MARRPALKIIIGLAASIATLSVASAQSTQPTARPNIVVFLADDLGYRDIGPTGDPNARTPNLDRLAAEGIQFDRAFVASPTCAPSRASLLTGYMP